LPELEERTSCVRMGVCLSRKSSLATQLEHVEDEVIEVAPEEELTRPISGSPLLLGNLPRETVPLLDLDLDLEYD
jgi:hypothetical protein